MKELSTGHRAVYHEDGSVTHYTVEHEPAVEPMSTRQQIATLALVLAMPIVTIGGPAAFIAWAERVELRKDRRRRQKANIEIFNSIRP